jgi:hypothetical protein
MKKRKHMKNLFMNTLKRPDGAFMFWLAQKSLPAYTSYRKQTQPINNYEFYGTLAMIIIALLALKIIFQ